MNADYVITSKCLFTGLEKEPYPGGVAVKGNKITAVGPVEVVNAEIGEYTKVYSFEDNLIIPGLVESHAHFLEGALAESKYFVENLEKFTSKEEIAAVVKKFHDENPGLKKILGTGWFPGNWEDQTLPTKELLDEASPDIPVILTSADMHTGWCNSKGLELLDLPGDPTELHYPEMFGRDEDGNLTGLLFELAYTYYGIRKFTELDEKDNEEIRGNLLKTIAKCGVTMWDEVSGHIPFRLADFYDFKKLNDKGLLTVRLNWAAGINKDGDYSEAFRLQKEAGDGLLKVNQIKGLIDGVTPTHTAYMLEPYTDDPTTCGGEPDWTYEEYENGVITANAAGFGVRIHAIGDKAIRWCIDAFEKSNEVNDAANKGIKNAIEHIETIAPEDIPRIGAAGIVAAMQPEHLPQDNNDKLTRLGLERAKTEWAFKSIQDAGAILAFGSDYPVATFSPFSGMYYAITRNGYDGKPTGFNPEEKISLYDTLRAYTYGGAYVSDMEDILGTLEVGKLADIAVLDRNLFDIDVEQFKDTQSVLTMVDGKIVYEV